MNEVKQAIHSAASLSAAFSEADLQANPILRYFHFAHLPDSLKEISGSFCALALRLLTLLPPSAERTAGLRKLLEAKDCAVRANLPALVFGDEPAAPSTSNFEKELQEHFKGRTHQEPDWQARLRTERWDLIHKIEALRVKLADPVFTSEDVDEDMLDLMDEQFQTMYQYLDIISRRMKLLGMALEDEPSPLGELREVGGFDEDRDGPVPFK